MATMLETDVAALAERLRRPPRRRGRRTRWMTRQSNAFVTGTTSSRVRTPRRPPRCYAARGSSVDARSISPSTLIARARSSFASASRSSWRVRCRVIPSSRPTVARERGSPSKPKRSSITRCSSSVSIRTALKTARRRSEDTAVAWPLLGDSCFVIILQRKLGVIRCTCVATIGRRKRTPRLVFPDRSTAQRTAFGSNRARSTVTARSTTKPRERQPRHVPTICRSFHAVPRSWRISHGSWAERR